MQRERGARSPVRPPAPRRSARGRCPRGVGRRTSSASSSTQRSSAQPVSRLAPRTGPRASARARRRRRPPARAPAAARPDRRPPASRKLIVAGWRSRSPSSSGRPCGDDPPAGDDRDPVGEPLGLVHVVGGQEDRLAEVAQPAITSHAWRRADGSKPVVGSSRKSSSGSPTRATPTSRRRSWPPERLPARSSAFARGRRARSSPRRRAAPGSSRRRARASRARVSSGRIRHCWSTIPIRSRQSRVGCAGSCRGR